MTSKDNYQLKTLNRGLEVLDLLKSAPVPLTLSELSRALGETNSVIFRILKTLESAGQIRQLERGKGYLAVVQQRDSAAAVQQTIRLLQTLGGAYPEGLTTRELSLTLGGADPSECLQTLLSERLVEEKAPDQWRMAYGCLELVTPLLSQDDLASKLRPVMEVIRQETRETVILFRISGERQYVIVSLPSRQPIRYVLNVGNHFPLYRGAAGKVALAYMPQSYSHRYLESCEVPDRPGFLRQLTRIRHDGYALSISERVEGAAGVAVPICAADGELVAVISVVLPAFRAERAKLEELAKGLRRMLFAAGYRSDVGS